MPISARLAAAADFIAFRRVADIGADHAFLPIYALERGLADFAVACDVSPACAAKAAKNVAASRFADKIQVRAGDGLKPLTVGETDCAVLAGMGGLLMEDILRASPDIVGGLKQLILQPQSDADIVRKTAHALGFVIADEKIVYERKMYYTIIDCRRDAWESAEAPETYGGTDYVFGKTLLARKDPLLARYLAREARKCAAILREIREKGGKAANARAAEVERYLSLIWEAEKCLRT